MPRGAPDYFTPNTAVSSVPFDPSAVVTAILGINSVDGLGRMWAIDTFQNGLGRWNGDSGGDAEIPKLTSAWRELGGVGLVFNPGTLVEGGESALSTSFILNSSPRIGFEAGIFVTDFMPDIYFFISWYKTGETFTGILKFSERDRNISVYSNGVYNVVAVLESGVISGGWMPLKLVMDFSDGRYARLVYGQISVDISAYDTPTAAIPGIGTVQVRIHAVARRNFVDLFYMGHVIMTTDEP